MHRLMTILVLLVSIPASALAEEEGKNDYALKLSPPDLSAFSLLDINPSQVARPATARELAMAVVNSVGVDGTIQPGLAVEWAPFQTTAKSLAEYRENDRLTGITLSVATSADGNDKRGAVGVRWVVIDDSDPRLDLELSGEITQVLAEAKPLNLESASGDLRKKIEKLTKDAYPGDTSKASNLTARFPGQGEDLLRRAVCSELRSAIDAEPPTAIVAGPAIALAVAKTTAAEAAAKAAAEIATAAEAVAKAAATPVAKAAATKAATAAKAAAKAAAEIAAIEAATAEIVVSNSNPQEELKDALCSLVDDWALVRSEFAIEQTKRIKSINGKLAAIHEKNRAKLWNAMSLHVGMGLAARFVDSKWQGADIETYRAYLGIATGFNTSWLQVTGEGEVLSIQQDADDQAPEANSRALAFELGSKFLVGGPRLRAGGEFSFLLDKDSSFEKSVLAATGEVFITGDIWLEFQVGQENRPGEASGVVARWNLKYGGM